MIDKLTLKQVTRKTEALRAIEKEAYTRTGWIKCIRQSIGMSGVQLAKKIGISQNSLSELEKREVSGSITIKKLDETAKALGCRLVYGFIPKENLEEMVEQIALKKAQELLGLADTHMSLEDQEVTSSKSERIELLKNKLINKGDIW